MKYWHDHEFLEDGRTIELISTGIVCEDGREYYRVNQDAPWERIQNNEWLMDNVVPSLDAVSVRNGVIVPNLYHKDMRTRLEMRREIVTFFRAGNAPVELWAWYGAYDHVVLAQLFGRLTDLPYQLIPMWTNDLRQEVERLGCYNKLPQQEQGEHNALEDARFLKLRHEFVQDWDRNRREMEESRP